jgi:hypothetical protein
MRKIAQRKRVKLPRLCGRSDFISSPVPSGLLIATGPDMTTAVIGLQELIPQIDDVPKWNVALANALPVMLPPILVV